MPGLSSLPAMFTENQPALFELGQLSHLEEKEALSHLEEKVDRRRSGRWLNSSSGVLVRMGVEEQQHRLHLHAVEVEVAAGSIRREGLRGRCSPTGAEGGGGDSERSGMIDFGGDR